MSVTAFFRSVQKWLNIRALCAGLVCIKWGWHWRSRGTGKAGVITSMWNMQNTQVALSRSVLCYLHQNEPPTEILVNSCTLRNSEFTDKLEFWFSKHKTPSRQQKPVNCFVACAPQQFMDLQNSYIRVLGHSPTGGDTFLALHFVQHVPQLLKLIFDGSRAASLQPGEHKTLFPLI